MSSSSLTLLIIRMKNFILGSLSKPSNGNEAKRSGEEPHRPIYMPK
jgi:hypothetical protein